MAPPTLAWGDANLYALPDGRHLWGREFELLPSGTMLAAKSILHGVIGIDAEPLEGDRCRIRDDASMVIYEVPPTESIELDHYRDHIIEGYRIKQAQQA